MDLQQRINAFAKLGKFLGQFTSEEANKKKDIFQNEEYFDKMLHQLELAKSHNGWFTEENLYFTCKSWSEALSIANLNTWVSKYDIPDISPKTIAVIMAGNIPLVGFHDFLSVLITGNKVLAKLSSHDKQLLPFLSQYLVAVEPDFKNYISFTEERLKDFDAVIATGSNNTARYFNYYFGKHPNIIRKNRNSVAVLTGNEKEDHMNALADDIFRYFGLGCRNVSKIYIPEEYNFDLFFNGIYSWKHIINNAKYINNYDYNKAVYLMGNEKLLDNEFMLLKEEKNGFSSPIAVVFYEVYSDLEALKNKLSQETENIQVVIGNAGIENEIPFGKAQTPQLWDYADGIDTVDFLLKIS